MGKKQVVLTVEECLRPPTPPLGLTVCFAPIKGGRMETIIEKATELGASVLQPVITQRSIVDKVNRERAEAIAREAVEQCERIDWPEIREPVNLLRLLGDWPSDMPLVYGDESGGGVPVKSCVAADTSAHDRRWAILAGPVGGFTPEELAALRRLKAAHGVGLGPRILRADTAIITLCVATLLAWGDWHQPPRFEQGTNKGNPFIIARSHDPFDKDVQYDSNGQVLATPSNPNALSFVPTYVFAPNQGIRMFLGLRYTLK